MYRNLVICLFVFFFGKLIQRSHVHTYKRLIVGSVIIIFLYLRDFQPWGAPIVNATRDVTAAKNNNKQRQSNIE